MGTFLVGLSHDLQDSGGSTSWGDIGLSEPDEHGVAWDDAAIGLPWRVNGTPPVLSERDLANPPLSWDQIPSFS